MRTTVPWNDEHLISIVAYTPTISDYSSQEKVFVAGVSHSQAGLQTLYFQDYYKNYYAQPKTCSVTSYLPDTAVLTFNGQAVKMLRWCKKFNDTNNDYYQYIPATERGHSYVVNLFKTATKPVEVRINNDTLLIPVMGFTRIWNSAGGNAI